MPSHSSSRFDLRHLLELPEDWDTYGAPRISQDAIRTAQAMTAVPTALGGVQLELHAAGVEIEIEILPSGRVKSILYERVA